MVRFTQAALIAFVAAAAATSDQGACLNAAEEPEDSFLLQRPSLNSPASARALLQAAESSPELPEGFSLQAEAFKFYDFDGDARITVQDLQKKASEEVAYGELLGEQTGAGPFTVPDFKHMISRLDSDSNGYVSWAEFHSASTKDTRLQGTSEDRAHTRAMLEAFKKAAIDLSLVKTNNLSTLELLQQIQQRAKAVRRQAKANRKSRRRTHAGLTADATADHTDVHVYTFGAPAVADPPLWNSRAGDGRFTGLRVVNRDRVPGYFTGFWTKTDPATFGVSLFGFRHPLIDVLVLKKFDLMEPEHMSLLGNSELQFWPGMESPQYYLSLHLTSTYSETVAAQAHWPVLQRMLDYSIQVYNPLSKLSEAARTHGSRLVEHYFQHDDSVGLLQDESTLECTLAFSGSDNPADWVNNANMLGETFCGFEDVHRGFCTEMRRILSSDHFQKKFRSKLPKCSKLYTTGHSLGGALATLFAACANSADVPEDDEDALLVKWTPAKPVLMKAKSALTALKNASSA